MISNRTHGCKHNSFNHQERLHHFFFFLTNRNPNSYSFMCRKCEEGLLIPPLYSSAVVRILYYLLALSDSILVIFFMQKYQLNIVTALLCLFIVLCVQYIIISSAVLAFFPWVTDEHNLSDADKICEIRRENHINTAVLGFGFNIGMQTMMEIELMYSVFGASLIVIAYAISKKDYMGLILPGCIILVAALILLLNIHSQISVLVFDHIALLIILVLLIRQSKLS